MIAFADTPSLGLLIGGPIVVLILLVCLAVFVWGVIDDYYRLFFCGGAVVVALVTLVVAGICYWPWKHDYHFWKPVNGRVEKISSRLISAGDKGGTNQRFVVVLDGQPYGVDDTRAALVKVGDYIRLKCKREFEWGSSNNGWGCRWNGGGA